MKYETVYRCSWYNDQFKSKKGILVKEISDDFVIYSIGDGKHYNTHRVDGPAVIDMDECGDIDFWVNGVVYYSTELYCQAAGMSDEETFMWVLRFGDKLPTTCSEFYGEGWESIPFDQF